MKASRNDIMTNPQTISFELSQSALQARRNAKWNQYDADVIPAFVADMDFAVAAPIQAAIERIVRDRDYGYPLRNGERADRLVANVFAGRMKSRYGWELSPDLVMPMADLVQGLFCKSRTIRRFAMPSTRPNASFLRCRCATMGPVTSST